MICILCGEPRDQLRDLPGSLYRIHKLDFLIAFTVGVVTVRTLIIIIIQLPFGVDSYNFSRAF